MILLDTNVVSEPLRPQPDAQVMRWLNIHFPESAISSITILELRTGVMRMPKGKRRDAMDQAIDRTIRRFGGRIYSFDLAAAQASAQLYSVARSAGRGANKLPEKLADIQIAGIAVANGLAIATRNTADYEVFGLDLIDPWEGE